MKIFIIGSSQYQKKMVDYAVKMDSKGHEVILPALDDSIFKSTLEILQANKERMQGADEVHLFYDGKSHGSIFDFGMAVALDKPLKIIYMNDKNIVNAMEEYARQSKINDKAWVTSRYYQDIEDLDKNEPAYVRLRTPNSVGADDVNDTT